MPIYEYKCRSCDKVFEYQQRMSDDPKTICEECSGELERIISRSAFHLKGGGWYKDLYSSTKPESKGTSDSPASESSSSDAGSSTASGSTGDSSSSEKNSSPSSSSSSSDSGSTTPKKSSGSSGD